MTAIRHGASNPQSIVLGIESSCDETAAAVVARGPDGRGRILSSVVRSQWEKHRPYGGVVPEIAARAHAECLDDIIREAMSLAGLKFSDLSGIAATAGPGLMGGLIVGVTTAKAIALVHGLPFVAVNHLEAHALTVGLTDGLDPPYLLLLVSGGHTQLLVVEGVGRYNRLGTTIDDALGEAFDKTAKLLGLPQPGGPSVEAAAREGDGARFRLPRPMAGRAEPNFSFAGLKTAVRVEAQKIDPLTMQDVRDICAAFQEAVVDSVIDRTRRAMQLATDVGGALSGLQGRSLVVAGGVAANKRLSAALGATCERDGWRLAVPPVALCTDNAAMIGWAGALLLEDGRIASMDCAPRARWPLDAAAPAVLGSGRLGAKA